jgi:hypothetical protein
VKKAVLFILVFIVSGNSWSQDFYKRFVNRIGYGLTDIEAKDSSQRKATTTSSDIFVHGGLQMKLSPLWSGQFELTLRHQSFMDDPHTSSFLLSGQFDFRRKVLPRFDMAITGGLKQENFLYGDGSGEVAVKKLSLPSLGIINYIDMFRFITSGISLKLAYLRYFSSGSDQVNVKDGNALRAGLVYLLRYRNIDWSLEYLHERSKYNGNYDQDNILNSLTFGMAYE